MALQRPERDGADCAPRSRQTPASEQMHRAADLSHPPRLTTVRPGAGKRDQPRCAERNVSPSWRHIHGEGGRPIAGAQRYRNAKQRAAHPTGRKAARLHVQRSHPGGLCSAGRIETGFANGSGPYRRARRRKLPRRSSGWRRKRSVLLRSQRGLPARFLQWSISKARGRLARSLLPQDGRLRNLRLTSPAKVRSANPGLVLLPRGEPHCAVRVEASFAAGAEAHPSGSRRERLRQRSS
jgi:hypothetical protein